MFPKLLFACSPPNVTSLKLPDRLLLCMCDITGYQEPAINAADRNSACIHSYTFFNFNTRLTFSSNIKELMCEVKIVFFNTDKHWLRDKRGNQGKPLSAGAKLSWRGAESDIQSDGKRLLSAISEIRNVPRSPGTGWTAMKASWAKEPVRHVSEWLILLFSRLS